MKNGFDGIMVVLDKPHTKKAAEVICNKILKIKGVNECSLAIMNIEKVISFAEKQTKKIKRVWIRLNETFVGILEKDGIRKKSEDPEEIFDNAMKKVGLNPINIT